MTRPPEPLASRRHTFRFLLIVGGVAAAALLQQSVAVPGSPPAAPASRIPLYVSLLALELAFVWFVAIGLRKRGRAVVDLVGRRWHSPLEAAKDILLAVAAVLVLRGLSWALHWVLGPAPAKTAFLLPRGFSESLLWVVVAITAGICEEAVFRGYLQPQLWALTGSLTAGVLLQALIFGVTHLYQGWRPALVTSLYGLGFGLLAAWRRSILPGAIAHSLIDIIGGLANR
jgi:hypothetical protein